MKRTAARLLLIAALTVCCCLQAFALPESVIPGGCTVGIKLCTKGLLVTGFADASAAREAGIRKGDIITEIDGELIHTAADLRKRLSGNGVILTVRRNGRDAEFCVKPHRSEDGLCIGAYVRDSMAGIGTVTYYDPETGAFGALGHGVSDPQTSTLLPMEAGVVVHASVVEVEKSVSGDPGELKGKFDPNRILGTVDENSRQGIFGELETPLSGTPIPVAEAEEVHTGEVEILSNIHGTEVVAYTAEIIRIYPHAEETGRNLLLQITDPHLLTATGGIVQGMSGSPIIQDGKLVGAVTHVLVNDPTRGYGIFIENMLDAAA